MSGLTLYHTGIVVDDIDAAMDSYGRAFGLHWAPPLTVAGAMLARSGLVGREIRATYSVEGPHHIELIEQVDATAYLGLTGGPRIHHLGYYTSDVEGESARLERDGFERELASMDASGATPRATFHRNPLAPGMWIELIDVATIAPIEAWLSAAASEHGIEFHTPFH